MRVVLVAFLVACASFARSPSTVAAQAELTAARVVGVDVSPCVPSWLDTPALVRALAVELRTMHEGVTVTEGSADVVVRVSREPCEDEATTRAEVAVTGVPSIVVDLADTAPALRARTLAMAMSGLVSAALSLRAGTGSDTDTGTDTGSDTQSQSETSTDAPRAPAANGDEVPDADVDAGLALSAPPAAERPFVALLAAFRVGYATAAAPVAIGGGLDVVLSPPVVEPLALRLSIGVMGAQSDGPLGVVSAELPFAELAVGAALRFGVLELGASGALGVVAVLARGATTRSDVRATETTGIAVDAWGLVHAAIRPAVPWIVRLDLGVGAALSGFEARAGDSVALAWNGVLLGARLAVGLEL